MTREQEIMEGARAHDYDLAFAEVFTEGAKWADAHPQWISVEDDLPKENGRYLVFNGVTKSQEIFVYINRIWWYNADRCPNGIVTHWMPLPAPPKAEDNG